MFSFLLFLLVLGACSSEDKIVTERDTGENKGTAEEIDSDEVEFKEVTLTFLIDNQSVMDGLEAVSDRIEEKYNIITEFEVRPAGTEGDNIIKTRLATGEMTDIMWYNAGSLFGTLNPEEYF